jgi:hypothetical protein
LHDQFEIEEERVVAKILHLASGLGGQDILKVKRLHV